MQIYLPKKQLEQPKNLASINSNNPLTDKLIFAWIPGAPGDLVYGRNFAINSRAEKVTQFGRCTDPTSVTTEKRFANFTSASDPLALLYDDQSITIFGIFRQIVEPGVGYVFSRANGSGTATWHLGLQGGSYDGPTAKLGNYSYTPSASDPTMVGNPHTVCITGDGSTLDLFYDKNQIVYGQTYAPVTPEYNTTRRSLIVGNIGNLSGANTECYLALAFRGKITADKYYELQRNPWQLFNTQKRVIYFDPISGVTSGNASGSILTNTNLILPGNASVGSLANGALIESLTSIIPGNITANSSISGSLLTSGSSIINGTVSSAVNLDGSLLNSTTVLTNGTISGSCQIDGSILTNSPTIINGTASSSGIGNASGATLSSTNQLINGTISVPATVSGNVISSNSIVVNGTISVSPTINGVILANSNNLISGNISASANFDGIVLNSTNLLVNGQVSVPVTINGLLINSATSLISGNASVVLSGNAEGSILTSNNILVSGIPQITASIAGKTLNCSSALVSGNPSVATSFDILNNATGSNSVTPILGSKRYVY